MTVGCVFCEGRDGEVMGRGRKDRGMVTWVLENRSAMERVIFRWVWESVECGRNVNLEWNTAWPWRPVPVTYT